MIIFLLIINYLNDLVNIPIGFFRLALDLPILDREILHTGSDDLFVNN